MIRSQHLHFAVTFNHSPVGLCRLGHFCPNSTHMEPCTAGMDLCPEGSKRRYLFRILTKNIVTLQYCFSPYLCRKQCPDGYTCSLEFACADSTTKPVWFSEAMATNQTADGSSIDLLKLPECASGALFAEIQAAETVKLHWDKIDCSNLTAAFDTTLTGLTTQLYSYTAALSGEGNVFRATMQGKFSIVL